MPCDTISTAGVELADNITPDLLVKALAALNLNPQSNGARITWYGGSFDLATKKATISASAMAGQSVEASTAAIKVAYGHQIAQQYAKQYGWKLTLTADNKYKAVKATY